MNYKNEVWADIKGWEGIYQVSNYGRLKSFKQSQKGKILKTTNKPNNYISVVLSIQRNNKTIKQSCKLHRLVATAFLPNPNNLKEVNHIDFNKHNNEIDNLEWVTKKENTAHAIKGKPQIINHLIDYNKNRRPKAVIQFDKNMKYINRFKSSVEAQEKTGICSRNILQVCSKTPFNNKGNVRKTAGGYIWKYESEVVKDGI